MSQYGAYGFAAEGRRPQGDPRPLLHGHADRRARGRRRPGARAAEERDAGSCSRTPRASPAGGALDPAKRYIATRGLSGAVTLRSASGRDLGSYASPLTITGAGGGFQINGRSGNAARNGRYRGTLQLRASAIGGISAINALGLDDYIRGVVAGEMPSALAAGGAARAGRRGAHLRAGDEQGRATASTSTPTRARRSTTASRARRAATDEAVAATAGEVVAFEGKPIVTYYFSTSGGRTEDVENVFLGAEPAPYLRSVEDPYDDASPRHRWTRRMSLRSAQRRLGGLVKGGCGGSRC